MSNAKTRSILVVDDSKENLELLDTILRTAGYKVRLAPNGTLALRSIQASTPDLILLDVNMPDMSGLEVCRRIRAELGLSKLPILFLSGANTEEQKQNIFKAGGDALIGKPYRINDLISSIESYLN